MELLDAYDSSSSSDDEKLAEGRCDERAFKREREVEEEADLVSSSVGESTKRLRGGGGGGGGGGVPNGEKATAGQGESSIDGRSKLRESLERLLKESSQLPSDEMAAERKRNFAWFETLCRTEFQPELDQDRGQLVVFGSSTYNMWVAGSDIDVNVYTLAPIPKFFARLRSAVAAAKESDVKVEIVKSASVPLARICVRTLQIDVTHEFGDDNKVAQHHIQVLYGLTIISPVSPEAPWHFRTFACPSNVSKKRAREARVAGTVVVNTDRGNVKTPK
jgi:hypothetical protein